MPKSRKKQPRSPLLELRPDKAKTSTTRSPLVPRTPLWLPPAAAIAVTLIGGLVHGLQTNRWIDSRTVEEASARLQEVPLQFGDWTGTDLPVDEREMKVARADAWLNREYKHRDGRRVRVMIVCGSHGPISLHDPTVCFTGAGWSLEDSPAATSVRNDRERALGQFFVARFHRTTPSYRMRMRTCWAWNAEGRWESPGNPRMAFAGAGHLYKLYVSEPLPFAAKGSGTTATEAFDTAACREFLKEFIPVLTATGI